MPEYTQYQNKKTGVVKYSNDGGKTFVDYPPSGSTRPSDSSGGNSDEFKMPSLVSNENVGLTQEPQVTAPLRIAAKIAGNLPSSAINLLLSMGHTVGDAVDTGSKLFSDEGRTELSNKLTKALQQPGVGGTSNPVLSLGGKTLYDTISGMAHKYSPFATNSKDWRTAPLLNQVTEDPVGTAMDVYSAKGLVNGGARAALGDIVDSPSLLKKATPSAFLERKLVKELNPSDPGKFRLNLQDLEDATKATLAKNNPDLSVGEISGNRNLLRIEGEQPEARVRNAQTDATTDRMAQDLLDKSGPLKLASNQDPQKVSAILRSKIKEAIAKLPEDVFRPVVDPGSPAIPGVPAVTKPIITETSPPTSALTGKVLKEAEAQRTLDETRKIVPTQDLSSNQITPGVTPASQSGYIDPTQPYQPIKFGKTEVSPAIPGQKAVAPTYGEPVVPRVDAVKWLQGGMKALKDGSDADLVQNITKNSTTFEHTFNATGIDPAMAPQLLVRKAMYGATTNGTFDASKLISNINNDRELWNSSVIKGLPNSSEIKAGLQQFAHRLDAVAKRSDVLKAQAALQMGDANAGMNIIIGGGATQRGRGGMGKLTFVRGVTKKILNISDASLAKLATTKDGGWILSKLADMNQGNVALPGVVNRLMRVAGVANIPVTLKNADGTESKVGE